MTGFRCERRVQYVGSRLTLTIGHEGVAARVDPLLHRATQDHPVLAEHRFAVEAEGVGIRLLEDDRPPVSLATEEAAVEHLDRRMHELAIADLGDRTKLHAGCGVIAGQRFVVVGRGGAGKTTLMTRLLSEPDCQVEGDELVLVSGGTAAAYPRRFGVRRLTLTLVPAVGSLAPHLTIGPEALEPGGYHVMALDPTRLDVPWHIGQGPVDVIFLLQPRVSGDSHVEPADSLTTTERLMEQSAAPDSGSAAWVRDLTTLTRNARAFRLTVGTLDSAVACVRRSVGSIRNGR